jgi:hypothetical protein
MTISPDVPPAEPLSYTALYYDLVDSIARERPWRYLFGLALLMGGFLGLLYLVFFFVDPAKNFGSLVRAVLWAGTCVAFVGIPFLAWLNNRDPRLLSRVLAIRLLLYESRPGMARPGLSRADLRHLRRMAEIDQSSADWRGSFITHLVVLVLVIILGANAADAQVPDWMALNYRMPGRSLIFVLMTLFTFALILYVVLALLNHLRRFLGAELANRVILDGCEEAEAVFEEYSLGDKSQIPTGEDERILARFGCFISDYRPARLIDYLVPPNLLVPLHEEYVIALPGGAEEYILPLSVRRHRGQQTSQAEELELEKTARVERPQRVGTAAARWLKGAPKSVARAVARMVRHIRKSAARLASNTWYRLHHRPISGQGPNR